LVSRLTKVFYIRYKIDFESTKQRVRRCDHSFLTIRGQKEKEKQKENKKQQQKEKAFNPKVEKNLSVENT
jgi:hypothetical protein